MRSSKQVGIDLFQPHVGDPKSLATGHLRSSSKTVFPLQDVLHDTGVFFEALQKLSPNNDGNL